MNHVPEHIILWESYHGRKLGNGWVIHHVNGDTLDNRKENLLALSALDHNRFIGKQQELVLSLDRAIARKSGIRWPTFDNPHLSYLVCSNGHRLSRFGGKIRSEILVWEERNGATLTPFSFLFHLNGVKKDNRIENLALSESREHKHVLPKIQDRISELTRQLESVRQSAQCDR